MASETYESFERIPEENPKEVLRKHKRNIQIKDKTAVKEKPNKKTKVDFSKIRKDKKYY